MMGPLRALQLDVHFQLLGVSATIWRLPPDDEPVETRIIAHAPLSEDLPYGTDGSRIGARRLVSIRRSVWPTRHRGGLIDAALPPESVVKRWTVDGVAPGTDEGQVRLILVPVLED